MKRSISSIRQYRHVVMLVNIEAHNLIPCVLVLVLFVDTVKS